MTHNDILDNINNEQDLIKSLRVVSPGDVVVLVTQYQLTVSQYNELATDLNKVFIETGVKFVILDYPIDIALVEHTKPDSHSGIATAS